MSSSDSFELFSSSSAADSSASAAALVQPGSAEAPPRLSVRELLANEDLVAQAEAASQSDYHAARLAALRAGGGGGSANPGSGSGPTEAVPIHAGNASSPALGLSSSSSASEHNIKVSEVLADRRRLAQMEEMAATITTASKKAGGGAARDGDGSDTSATASAGSTVVDTGIEPAESGKNRARGDKKDIFTYASVFGRWEGTVVNDGKPSNVAISFSDPADAPEEARGGPGANPLIVGACDLLDLGMKNLRLENIEVFGDGTVTYEMAFRGIGRGTYELAVDGNVATGSWEWGSKSGEMRFVRKSGGSPLVVTTKGMMRKVIRFNKDSWKLVLVGAIAALVVGMTPMLFFNFLGDVITALMSDNVMEEVGAKCKVLAILAGVVTVATGVQTYCFQVVRERFTKGIRVAVFRSLVHQEMSFFDANATGEIASRLGADVVTVTTAYTDKLAMIIQQTALVVFGLVLAFIESWKLTLVNLAIVPIVGVIFYVKHRYTTRKAVTISNLDSKAMANVADTLSGLRTVRAYNQEETEVSAYGEMVGASYGDSIKRAIADTIGMSVVYAAIYYGYVIGFYVGAVLVVNGSLEAGKVFSVFSMVIFAFFGAMGIMAALADLSKGAGTGAYLFALLERAPKIDAESAERRSKAAEVAMVDPTRSRDDYEPAGRSLSEVDGHIAFEDVFFYYPTRPDVTVMASFSLNIEAGSTVALVGPSGSGKSTTVSLLERFYLPAAGRITVDGVDLNDLDPVWWRSQLAMVKQEPNLFNDTIRHNIAYGRPDATDAEVEDAARRAFAHDFILEQPDGYDTVVGEKGVTLSGGQRQRIAIARALIQDPRILLLDEATSSLDAQSEHLVHQAIDNLREGRTIIIVAHRLSTVRNADKIVVIHKGEVREEGSHDELVDKEGSIYGLLVSRQMGGAAIGDVFDKIDKELEIMTTVGSMGGPDKETKGLDEIVVYRFPGNAPSMPILADPSNPDSAAEPLPWKTVTSFEMSKSSAPREGFHVAFGKDKGVVSVKACTNTLACELFVFRLARMLDLNVPTLRPVLKTDPEFDVMVEAVHKLDLASGSVGASRVRRYRTRYALLVEEYISGGKMRSLRYCDPADIRALHRAAAGAPLTPPGKFLYRKVGSFLAFNMWLNNTDGMPVGDVWRINGNPKNIIYHYETDAVYAVDTVCRPILHGPMVEAYTGRVTVALDAILAARGTGTVAEPFRALSAFFEGANSYPLDAVACAEVTRGLVRTARDIVGLDVEAMRGAAEAVRRSLDGAKFVGVEMINVDFLVAVQDTLRRVLESHGETA